MTGPGRRTVLAGLAAAGLGACAGAAGPRAGGMADGLPGGRSGGGAPSLYYLHRSKVFAMTPPVMTPRELVNLGDGGQGVNDGIAIDHARGHIYWTNMGVASARDGFIMRSDLNGGNLVTIVPPGGTHTPKQLKMDATHLYWSDREGMAVMRCRIDGTNIETLVTTGRPDVHTGQQARWCVGMALDTQRRHIYWTQKGGDNAHEGMIRRCSMDMPAGATPTTRPDVETLFARMPEPIDLDLDLARGHIYWTDRGDNTISRAPMHPAAGFDPVTRSDREILLRDLGEAIGIALDLPRGRMAWTSLGGEVGVANMDGSGARRLATGQGLLTGAAWG
jgi:hypothetical protein